MEETSSPEVPASESVTGSEYGFEDDSVCGDLGVPSWVVNHPYDILCR